MIAILALTKKGRRTAGMLESRIIGGSKLYFPSRGAVKGLVGRIFDKDKFEGIIFIMALGIVVRLIAPHLKGKLRDPAVVAIDETGDFAISVVSGHEGGANRLAIEAGNILYAEPVITTASETRKRIVVGVGCRRGVRKEEVLDGIKEALGRTKARLRDLKFIATIDLKRSEPGLKDACLELGVPLRIIQSGAIKNFKGSYQRSPFVKKKIGVEGVSEPCALLAARNPKLLLPRTKAGRVMIAVAADG